VAFRRVERRPSDVSSVALQQKLRDLEQAFQNFFDGRAGSPNFKRKHGKQTARFASNAFTRYGNAFTLYGKALSVAKVPGELNVRWSRDLSDSCTVTSVTLTKDSAGRYFVSLTCTEEKEPLPETDRAVGVDLGLTDVIVTSGGFKSGNPKHLGNDLYRLKKAQRRLSRKEKNGPDGPSENWKKQKRRVARLHARIADRRNDVLHKLSRKTARENQVIALESLNVKGMQRREARAASVQNRSLSRSISDTGWPTLVQYIEYFATSNTKPNGPGALWSRSTGGFPPRSGAPNADASGRRNRCRFGGGNAGSAPSVMIET